ncbi:MAG: RidA family protein [Phenylobacterium sp.]|jgi:enamine deaminase RidA (YjgF/YER057c/UK114 family)|nr:RidA family protein [Phenylobacterium sp.]
MRALALATLLASLAAAPAAAEITRVGPETSPIASAVVVPAGYDIIYVSGITPPVTNAGAPEGTPREFGDTKTQTIGVIERIKAILESQGAGLGDVVMMRVLLVGDPALDGKMDFAGMMEGYRQYFANAEQPNKPARITSQVSALVAPGMMVEIEVQAAVKPK